VVRSFPRTTHGPARARTVAVCATLVLAAVSAAVPHAAADDLKNKQRHVHSKVSTAQGDLDESSKALGAAARRLLHARAAMSVAQGRLVTAQSAVAAAARVDALMQARLQAAEHSLALARVALDLARARVSEQRSAIGRLAASDYANGDPALMGLVVILNSQDPAEVTSQMNTVDTLMGNETTLLADLREARARMVTEEAKVEQAKVAVGVQRQAARANLVHTQGLESVAATARAQVAALVVESRAAQAQAARAHQADLVVLRAAKKQEERIRQLILERARRQHGGFKGDTGGFLLRPVPGVVTSPYGWRIHPIYGYWGLHDGTDFSAPCGTPERAVASGTVISRSWSDVYGNRLYLDLGQVNGKNMTVVYNHMSAYKASTGQHVSRGQTVGYAGTTGWSTGCHLHFTVMLDGATVDPMHYM
jgi:murein DD-endopeptidase MepM/ murein hydrolase activator NlpD